MLEQAIVDILGVLPNWLWAIGLLFALVARIGK